MASSQTAYTVTITNGATTTAPSDGFVDNLLIQNYGLDFETTPAGLTLTLCEAKRRGNLRYRNIIDQIGLVTNGEILPDTITSDATAITEASAFSFIVVIGNGDASLITRDELHAGVLLTGAACLQRCVARALIATYTWEIDIFDPTSSTSTGWMGATQSVPRFGVRVNAASTFTVGPYASNLTAADGYVAASLITF